MHRIREENVHDEKRTARKDNIWCGIYGLHEGNRVL